MRKFNFLIYSFKKYDSSMFPETIARLHNYNENLPAYIVIKSSTDHNHMV